MLTPFSIFSKHKTYTVPVEGTFWSALPPPAADAGWHYWSHPLDVVLLTPFSIFPNIKIYSSNGRRLLDLPATGRRRRRPICQNFFWPKKRAPKFLSVVLTFSGPKSFGKSAAAAAGGRWLALLVTTTGRCVAYTLFYFFQT